MPYQVKKTMFKDVCHWLIFRWWVVNWSTENRRQGCNHWGNPGVRQHWTKLCGHWRCILHWQWPVWCGAPGGECWPRLREYGKMQWRRWYNIIVWIFDHQFDQGVTNLSSCVTSDLIARMILMRNNVPLSSSLMIVLPRLETKTAFGRKSQWTASTGYLSMTQWPG